MIKVGFTGTREGMTPKQCMKMHEMLGVLSNKGEELLEFHHGDCLGADKDAHVEAILSEVVYKIVLHPPSNDRLRALCNVNIATPLRVLVTVEKPRPYLLRNQDIVDSSDVLIAAPKEKEEVLRSGTWATIRRAREKPGMQIVMLWRI